MAGDFTLSISTGFRDDTKVRKFTRLMGNPLAHALLVGLWSWAVDHAPNGDLSGIDVEEIEDGCGHIEMDGRCYRTMVACGFIDESRAEDGTARREIHNWMRQGRTGHAIELAEKERERWRRSKGITRRNDKSEPVGSTVVPTGVPRDIAGTGPGASVDKTGDPASSRFTVHGSRFTVQEEGDPEPPCCSGEQEEADARETAIKVSDHAASQPHPDPKPKPIGLRADELTNALRIAVEREHPEVGLYAAGPFAARDAREFLEDFPADRPADTRKLILERVDAFARRRDGARDGWTVKAFIRAFNTLAAPAANPDSPPKLVIPANYPRPRATTTRTP